MKDIAIYRLQRVEKALERLGAAVGRLEGATTAIQVPEEPDSSRPSSDGQLNLLQTELDSVRADYDRLRIAATTVAERLDQTIETLDPSVSADSGASSVQGAQG